MGRALFIGRFQPFHLGHLKAIEWILEREDEVIVAIGSPQYGLNYENPFTTGERIEMIVRALREYGIYDRCIIAIVPDTGGMHYLWATLVLSYVPKFDVAYSNNHFVKFLLERAGVKVLSIPFFNRERYCGKYIRKLMVEGGPWEELVPKSVAQFIKEIKGEERVRVLWEVEYGESRVS